MGKIYCLMGKSASGKDSIYKRVMKLMPELGGYVLYTTRPRRTEETDGVSYHFTDKQSLEAYAESGRLIEMRTYMTVYGEWSYATVDDGQIDLSSHDYFVPGTLDSYEKLKSYFGAEHIAPVYIELDDGERLLRAVRREMSQKEPKYKEMCRRFIADCDDFSEERLASSGITQRFVNDDLDRCTADICRYIAADRG